MSALLERAGTNVSEDTRQNQRKIFSMHLYDNNGQIRVLIRSNRGYLNYQPYNCKEPTQLHNKTELITQ